MEVLFVCLQPGRLSKLDKAEILELTVNHIKKNNQHKGKVCSVSYMH